MNKKLLFIPLVLFLGLVVMFMIQLTRNADGEDPTKLESVLVGKPVPQFKLEDLVEAGKLIRAGYLQGRAAAAERMGDMVSDLLCRAYLPESTGERRRENHRP